MAFPITTIYSQQSPATLRKLSKLYTGGTVIIETRSLDTIKDLVEIQRELRDEAALQLRAIQMERIYDLIQPLERAIDSSASVDLAPVSEEEAQWVEDHFEELQTKFGGQWVAIDHHAVVAHSAEIVDISRAVDLQGIVDPFVEWIPSKEETLPPFLI